MIKSSGIRKYTKENVESIRLIYTLLKKDGLTIQGAKKEVKIERYIRRWKSINLEKA